MDVNFLAIAQAILVAVPHGRGGAGFIEFVGVAEAVHVGVFISIDDTIPISILNQRVSSQHGHFNPVAESVLVRVSLQGIGDVGVGFLAILQSIAVGVRPFGIGVLIVKFIGIT